MACTCGHAEEEHGHDPQYPGSTACQMEDCECIAWEDNEGAEDDESDFMDAEARARYRE